jgi:hypothetical protein
VHSSLSFPFLRSNSKRCFEENGSAKDILWQRSWKRKSKAEALAVEEMRFFNMLHFLRDNITPRILQILYAVAKTF